jgi:NAD kinase
VSLAPRVVVVSRHSERDELIARHGTRAAAEFYLRGRGRDLTEVEARHGALAGALAEVGRAIPVDWRRGQVDRADLDRFLFAPEDIVVVVGQDGLVANVAKYLDGQPVIGVDPEPDRNPGVLVPFRASQVGALLSGVVAGQARFDERAMVVAGLDDGQVLIGLNEVFVGHASHQSARYVLRTPDGRSERHSSSGVIVGTGTGATGWCASIAHDRNAASLLPPVDAVSLCWFVREAWPSPATGTTLTAGTLSGGDQLELTSEGDRLVVFADGVEQDHLSLSWGQRITIGVAARRLRLVR